jgi:molybdenum cofactor synthesis domain-containing protein
LSDERIVTAAVLVIGDEILSGRTKEGNAGFIAGQLTGVGIRLREVRVVPDDENEIVDALNALRARYDYVFTTGGIGPTHDDITSDSVGKAFGRPVAIDPRAEKILLDYFNMRGVEATPARMRMARLPAGADLIENEVSVAPGFRVDNVFVMAGVPSIMQSMFVSILPLLEKGRPLLSVTISVDRGEGEIAGVFAAHQQRYPDVAMGSYPFQRDGRFASDLVLRATDPARLKEAEQTLRAALGLDR